MHSVLSTVIPNRDVVDLIHRLVHNSYVSELNRLYHSMGHPDDPKGAGYVTNFSRRYMSGHLFRFGYRSSDIHTFPVANYKYRIIGSRELSHNYWHAKLYPD